MVIIFYFIVIYQLNINMRPKRHKDIDFPSLCKKNEKPIYFIYILVKWSKIIIGKKIEKKKSNDYGIFFCIYTFYIYWSVFEELK